MSDTQKPADYNEASIEILEGLDPIKLRPSQFTRTDCPLHIAQEVLDNAIDEVLGGFATEVTLQIHADKSITVSDNGRGIPVGLHPEKKIPVVEAVFGRLYSGGKFSKGKGGAYDFSGGLHGVGVSVTNALSSFLEATIRRDGAEHQIRFENGVVTVPVHKLGSATTRGTSVHFKPNPKYFDSPEIPTHELVELLRRKSLLLAGLKVTYIDETGPEPVTQVFSYTNGLADFFEEVAPANPLVATLVGSKYFPEGHEQFSKGEGAEWALSWFESTSGAGQSFVNMIPTPDGGTHVGGLRTALFNAIREYAEQHAMIPKGVKLNADDVFKNVSFCLSARMLDPAFDNQTKDRLNSQLGVKLIDAAVSPSLHDWIASRPEDAKVIAALAVANAAARARVPAKQDKKKSSSLVILPGKLSDCESSDSAVTELFLVEGDSAGGSAKMGRDKDTQAVLPLRGKGLNSWEVDALRALDNAEINAITVATGIPLHTVDDELDWSKLRYGKICILADADVDGKHIQVLLLALFLRHFPQLILRGHIFIALPPLYRVDAEPVGKKKPAKKLYLMDKGEADAAVARLKTDGYSKIDVGRFKGLGEMNSEQLWETTLNPEARRLLQVKVPDSNMSPSEETMNYLMASANSGWRRNWLEEHGHEADIE